MGFQNFYATRLAADIGTSDTTIAVETAPSVTAGALTLEARNPTQREIIRFTGVSGTDLTGVTRGIGGTSAKSHLRTALVEMNVIAEDLDSTVPDDSVTTIKIFNEAVTGNKLSSTNYEVFRAAPSGTVETTGTSYIDSVDFGNMTIPTWATTAVFTWHGSSYCVSTIVDGEVKLVLGTGDETAAERTHYNSDSINDSEHWTFISEVALTGTGTQNLKLRIRELAGGGAIRMSTSSMCHVKVEYY